MSDVAEVSVSKVSIADKARWDEYVARHELATPYHRFAWQQAVKSAYRHDIAGAIATDPQTDKVVGVFPAVLMRIPFSGKQVCALPYCDLGFGLADSPEVLNRMQHHLRNVGQKAGSRYLEVRGLTQTPEDTSSLTGQKVRMVLPLPESGELLLKSFKSKLRSQIKKAEKNGLTVQLGDTREFINGFYDVYTQNMRDLGSPVHAKRWFEDIISAYGKNAVISVVYHENTPIGAGIVIKNAQTASIPWASTLREFNRLAPNMLLYWSLLEHCADNGIETFDFGRSTFEEGTYRFKKQWGAEPQLLFWQKFGQSGEELPQVQGVGSQSKLRNTIENTWRKLPLGLTIKLGSTIRPYISL